MTTPGPQTLQSGGPAHVLRPARRPPQHLLQPRAGGGGGSLPQQRPRDATLLPGLRYEGPESHRGARPPRRESWVHRCPPRSPFRPRLPERAQSSERRRNRPEESRRAERAHMGAQLLLSRPRSGRTLQRWTARRAAGTECVHGPCSRDHRHRPYCGHATARL